MPSPKRWLQLASDGGQDGGAGNGAAESLGERSVLEEVIPLKNIWKRPWLQKAPMWV